MVKKITKWYTSRLFYTFYQKKKIKNKIAMSLRKYGSKFSKLECLFFISSTTFPPSVTFFMTQGLKECLLFFSSTTSSVTLCNCSRLNALGNNYQVKATFYWGQPVRRELLLVRLWSFSYGITLFFFPSHKQNLVLKCIFQFHVQFGFVCTAITAAKKNKEENRS